MHEATNVDAVGVVEECTSNSIFTQLKSGSLEDDSNRGRAEEVHTLLMATALRGEGVAGVAETLAALLDRAVLIEDVYHEVLAEADWTEPSTQDRLVTDVTLEGAPVARIHVATGGSEDPGLSGLDVRAVEHATVVTALELLRARTAAEVEQRIRGSLVSDQLASDSADQASSCGPGPSTRPDLGSTLADQASHPKSAASASTPVESSGSTTA